MNTFSFAWMGVGGGAVELASRVFCDSPDSPPLVLVDTDVLALNACPDAEVLLIGETRFEGGGAGGHPVNGRLAALDDVNKLRRALMDVRLLVILTTLGGGTGTGATPEILKLARQIGIRTLCFAVLPFGFSPASVRAHADRALPQLEDASDALVVVPADALYADAAELPVGQAQAAAAHRLGEGLLLLHRLVSRPGHIKLGAGGLYRMLAETGGRCRFATASADGPKRAERLVADLCASPLMESGRTLRAAHGLLVGVLGGDDLRLKEIDDVMRGLRQAGGGEATTRLGTVLDPGMNGRLGLVVLAFERWQRAAAVAAAQGADPLAGSMINLPGGRGRKPPPASRLSFGPTGRGRFQGVAPTVFEGEDLDIPTYQRQGIVLDK